MKWAWGCAVGAFLLSMMQCGIPYELRRADVVSPTGPAPTMATGKCPNPMEDPEEEEEERNRRSPSPHRWSRDRQCPRKNMLRRAKHPYSAIQGDAELFTAALWSTPLCQGRVLLSEWWWHQQLISSFLVYISLLLLYWWRRFGTRPILSIIMEYWIYISIYIYIYI